MDKHQQGNQAEESLTMVESKESEPKRNTQSRKYCLVINNPLEHGYSHDEIKRIFAEEFQGVKYYCMADERGFGKGNNSIIGWLIDGNFVEMGETPSISRRLQNKKDRELDAAMDAVLATCFQCPAWLEFHNIKEGFENE